MYSKRIVISIIVIGCLTHFITCLNTEDNKKLKPKIPRKVPEKAGSESQPSNSPAPVRRRSLPPNNTADPKENINAKRPIKPAAVKTVKPPAADEEKEPTENAPDNPDGNEEPAEEKPTHGIRKVFRRIKNFSKKICPFRFFGRLVKKSLGLNKPKPTNDERQEVNPVKK